jgi:Tfp pilus assembly protein PilN
MKNRINLYHPSFHPKLQLLTLSSVIVSWVSVAIFCSLSYFYMMAEQQSFKLKITNLEQNKQQKKTLVDELNIALENIKVDPDLLKIVEEKQQTIQLKKRVLNELVGQENLKSTGFSTLMLDLAGHSLNGLWLTHIDLNGMSITIKGATTDSAFMPKWLSSLGQTEYFKGQNFSDTRLYRDSEEQLNFVISTNKELAIKRGSNND